MKFIKNILPILLGFLMIAGTVMAQNQQMQQQSQTEADSVTDNELEKFAEVSQKSQQVQQEMSQKVDSMLNEEDMEKDRFQQIMMSKRNPQMADSIEVSDQEEETMNKLQPKLMELNKQAQDKMVKIIKAHDLEPDRFQQIVQAIRTNPDVMERFQKLQQKQAGQQMQNN